MNDVDFIKSIEEELNQFEKSKMRHLIHLPLDWHIIGNIWVFRIKLDENIIITRNKSTLVVRGYNQDGIDYEETFSTIARIEAIRILVGFVAYMQLKLFWMDIESAFLKGYLMEEMYVK